MKILKFVLCLFIFTSIGCSKDTTTTYYLVRHAEKVTSDPNDRDPELTATGVVRALNYAEYFKDIQLDAVYSTPYKRTLETAGPTADSKNLKVIEYNPRNFPFDTIKPGSSILIVGHSNSTPTLVNTLLGEDKYEELDHEEYGTLFIVSVTDGNATVEVKRYE